MKPHKKTLLLLYSILVVAFSLRLFGINWDEGYHLHPDERAIILAILNLRFPENLSIFLTPESPWNTHFFAYGSFPFYLLHLVGSFAGLFDPKLAMYDGLQLVGRFLSALFDVGTVSVIFLVGGKIKNRTVGFLSAGLYAISVLPIQLSHFFAVDTILTFFILVTLYLLLLFYDKPTINKAIAIGVMTGFALATKISATVILMSVGLTICFDFALLFLRQPHRPRLFLPHVPLFLKKLIKDAFLICISIILTYVVLSPYTFIDFAGFQKQTIEQSRMTHDAFTFPYTFQYALKIPYIYELTNIFLFGLGPLITILSFVGLFLSIYSECRKPQQKTFAPLAILITFLISYFVIVGSFAIGFMRYMLPLYPLLCLFAGISLYYLHSQFSIKKNSLYAVGYMLLAILLLIWPVSYMTIYTKEHTRISATNWILTHIPQGATIAVEHWDDSLPLRNIEKYEVLSLPLYEPDTKEKWELMNRYLAQTDYIIIASNRLFTPLQKLTDCTHLPPGRCYIRTSLYYQSLFDGSLGFTKVAQFAITPSIPFTKFALNDEYADESFTVYDHPTVMIFKNELKK